MKNNKIETIYMKISNRKMADYLSQFEERITSDVLENSYIHHYETTQQFETAYNGSDYVAPWVSYTEDADQVTYNHTERIVF